jgi:hypothetical protein
MPVDVARTEPSYFDEEDYATHADCARMHEVSFTELAQELEIFEGACE